MLYMHVINTTLNHTQISWNQPVPFLAMRLKCLAQGRKQREPLMGLKLGTDLLGFTCYPRLQSPL